MGISQGIGFGILGSAVGFIVGAAAGDPGMSIAGVCCLGPIIAGIGFIIPTNNMVVVNQQQPHFQQQPQFVHRSPQSQFPKKP